MTLESLKLLARHWSTLFGKAQGYEVLLASNPIDGRSDAIDAKTPEIRQAIEALDGLKRLYEIDPNIAKLMLVVYVMWGEQQRLYKDSWVELWRELHPSNKHKKTATARHNHWVACLKLHDMALKAWERI